jgi:DNA primase
LKKGWCPLHKGNSPSFSFVDETGIFHCHSCQEEETPSSSTAS